VGHKNLLKPEKKKRIAPKETLVLRINNLTLVGEEKKLLEFVMALPSLCQKYVVNEEDWYFSWGIDGYTVKDADEGEEGGQ
jgi:hypothetical protein